MAKPKTLRQALNQIQDMLDGQSYSADLWDVIVALRGPEAPSLHSTRKSGKK